MFDLQMSIGCRWLLVFDNVDEPDIIQPAWPGGTNGSILLTSHDSATGFTVSAKECPVRPFDDETGTSVFLRLVNRDVQTLTDRAAAVDITRALGGLPLAIHQVSGFIIQQRLELVDFLPLYERNSAKIDSRKVGRANYEHTLSTVWVVQLRLHNALLLLLQNLGR